MPPPRAEPRPKGFADATAVAAEIDACETALERLRARYEQYFLGLDKRAPAREHEELRQRLAPLRTPNVRNAQLTFRVQSLQQRVSTYERLWSRTLQEIENGTYRRDLFKARLRRTPGETPAVPARPPEAAAPGGGAAADGAPATSETAPGAAPDRAAAPPGPAPRAPEPVIHIAGTPAPGTARRDPLSDVRLRGVYTAYVEAKRRCNEDVSKLSYDAVAASLRKQVPELLKKHAAADVEYRVFVKDGKAILRAVPKTG